MICVFNKDNLNFEGNGNAVLLPTEAKVRSVAGGNYDLTMVHPMEPEGKWKHLVPGAIVRVPIPEEEIENAFSGYEADVYKTTEEAALRESPSEPTAINYQQWNWQQAYEVGDKVSVPGWSHRNYECTYYDGGSQTIMVPPYNSSWWKAINDTTGGAAVLVTLPAGTELYFIEDVDATWYKMSTYYGIEGYIKKSQVEFWKHLTPEETKPRIIREQLFRITNATADTKSHVVNVTAQHVSYDLNGIIVQDVSIRQASPAMAIGRMVEGFMIPYDGTIATNLTSDDNGTYTDDIKGKTGMYCFLDPDKGIVGKFDAALKRDNWDLFILQKTNTNRGFSIRYRKNLLGVSWARKSDGLITRVVPVAKDEKGEALYLPEKWIDSDYINDYPVIRMERLSMKEQVGKDKGTGDGSTWTLSDLYDEMRAKAAERFTVDKADRIVDEVTVDFEQLSDTDEHAALKGFEKVLLYDAVTVIHEEIGLNMVMTVNELEWDAIRQKITSVKVSNVGNRAGRSVTGYNVQNKSIGWQKLTDDVGDDILSQVRDIIPEYADPDAPRPAIPVMNTKTQDGYVLKGGSNANKVWGTDASGNPGWTTPAAYTLPLAADGTRGGIQIGYSESGKKYAVKLDSEKAYVEVPWTADGGNAATVNGKTVAANVPADAKFTDHEYTAGTGLSLSNGQFAVRLAYTTSGKNYKVQADNSGNLYVNVPWENTVYSLPLAANGTRGGVQIGYTQSGKNYPVQLSSEKAYVNVPWTADGGAAATAGSFASEKTVELTGDTTGSASSTGGWSISTTTDQLTYKSQITSLEALDAFGVDSNVRLRVAKISSISGTGYGQNDGMIVSIPWSAQYGQQFFIDDSGYGLWHRYRGGSVWKDWKQILDSSRLNYPTSGKNYALQMDGDGLYVNVPWTDGMPKVGLYYGSDHNINTLVAGMVFANGQTVGNPINSVSYVLTFNPHTSYRAQMVIPYYTDTLKSDGIYVRTYNDNGLQAWVQMATKDYTASTYLPLAGGNMTAGARISASEGTLYLGNSGNQSWVMVQDICSQTGNDKWKILQNGTAVFAKSVTAAEGFVGNVTGNASGNVLKTGDTMSGGLILSKSGSIEVSVRDSSKSLEMNMNVGSGGYQGLWSSGYWNGTAFVSGSKWMIYRGTDGAVTVNGDCTGNSGTSSRLVGADTRSANDSPSSYYSNPSVIIEFKSRSTIGAPGTSSFGALSTVTPWNDSSGGYPVQYYSSSDGTTAVRYPNSASAWGAWRTFLDSSNYSGYAVARAGDTTTGDFTNTGNIANTGYFTNNGSLLIYPLPTYPAGSGGMITLFNPTRGFGINLQASSGGGSLSSTGYWNGSAYVESSLTILDRSTDGKAYFHGDADTVDGYHASSFVQKSGDTMTGTLNLQAAVNNVGVNFRPDLVGYYTTISHQTSGNEATVFATKNGVTSWIFVNGEDSITNHASDRWRSLTPGLQIKNNCVRIGGLWGNDVTPDYKLRVDGTGIFTENVYIQKAGEAYIEAKNTSTGASVLLDPGSGVNHGILSRGYNNGSSFVSDQKWMIYRDNTGTVTVTGNCTGSAGSVDWSGVTSRPIKYFGGSGTNSVTITFPGSGHVLMGLASGVGLIFISGAGSIYSTLPSGFSATCASGTYEVTITRSNSTTFYFHGLYLAGTTELPVS